MFLPHSGGRDGSFPLLLCALSPFPTTPPFKCLVFHHPHHPNPSSSCVQPLEWVAGNSQWHPVQLLDGGGGGGECFESSISQNAFGGRNKTLTQAGLNNREFIISHIRNSRGQGGSKAGWISHSTMAFRKSVYVSALPSSVGFFLGLATRWWEQLRA